MSTFSESTKNIGMRGKPMAWAAFVGSAAVLGVMYWQTKDVKKREDMASVHAHRGQGIGGTDKAMTSGDVSAVVTGSARPPVGGGSSQKQA